MKNKTFAVLVLTILAVFNSQLSTAHAQGTAFTYQGRLNEGANSAAGNYDLTFSLYSVISGAGQVGVAVTNTATVISNGLFTVTLDFGSQFPGANRWLEIGVRTNGANSFTALLPRQKLTPAPYAMFANTASNLSGAISASQLTGTIPSGLLPGFQGNFQTVGGGSGNNASSSYATVGGGQNNTANSTYATVGGGFDNTAGYLATVPGGAYNLASGFYSFAAGQSAKAIHQGAFVWADSQAGDFFSAANDQFLIRAQGGMGIGTNITTGNALTVAGNVSAASFSGSGAGLTGVPGGFPWQNVTGTTRQASANTGYLANNSQRVTITLPASLNPGDIIKVTGGGAGGWILAHGTNQYVINGVNTNVGNYGLAEPWIALATSADGLKMVAATSQQIFTSYGGIDWTPASASFGGGTFNKGSVASSTDGTKLVAVMNGAQVYTSADSGVTWTTQNNAPTAGWACVASSADGTKLVAAINSVSPIYTSSNSGVTWTPQNNSPTVNWSQIVASADGNKLAAISGTSDQIYTSTNAGVTWAGQSGAPTATWMSVASSADGTKLAAAIYNGQIYTSTNSGVAWTAQPAAPTTYWQSIASSADGTKLMAVNSRVIGTPLIPGFLYSSVDSGVTWTFSGATQAFWYSVTLSADGTRFAALYQPQLGSSKMLTGGITGYLIGEQYSTIELQYLGGGKLLMLYSLGDWNGN
jgi:hypothetical protein